MRISTDATMTIIIPPYNRFCRSFRCPGVLNRWPGVDPSLTQLAMALGYARRWTHLSVPEAHYFRLGTSNLTSHKILHSLPYSPLVSK